MVTAIAIDTALWDGIVKMLLNRSWISTYRYSNIDTGVDFDFVILEKDNEEILFGWDNWFEGEIQCGEPRLKYIERLINVELEKGVPQNLKPEIIEMHRTRKAKN